MLCCEVSWQKNLYSAKAACKMLVKLTTGKRKRRQHCAAFGGNQQPYRCRQISDWHQRDKSKWQE